MLRQQQPDVDWEKLEAEVETSAKSKAERVIAQLPSRLRVSRSREHDPLPQKKMERRSPEDDHS